MRSVVFASSVLVAGAAPPPNIKSLFEAFKRDYGRAYATPFEEGQRFQIFSENVETIYASNAKNLSYTLGITGEADRTFEEWRSAHLSGMKPTVAAAKNRAVFTVPKNFATPDSIDWATKGGVTSVKNQGTCGSCWTFSTVGALEGAMFIAGRPLVELSMQRILACDTGGSGCQGGSMDQAFDWVAKNGVPSLEDEPYLCKDGSECKSLTCTACEKKTGESCIFGTCNKVPDSTCVKEGIIHHCECPADQCFADGECAATTKPTALVLAPGDVTTHTDVDSTEQALEAAVAQQPVSVAIEADKSVFQHYTGGVITNEACGSMLDHGVLAVGYGEDDGQKYWKVKNSWGASWGEHGYVRIERGSPASGGECGIREGATFPTVSASGEVLV